MAENHLQPRDGNGDQPPGSLPLDVLVNSPLREGLTGTTPASVYKPPFEPIQISAAPDGRPMDQQPAWRQDFPIDWPQDHYISRRDFAKFLVLTSLAFVVGQVWIGVQNVIRRSRGKPPIQKIAALDEIAIGEARAFAYPGKDDACILIRPDSQTLLAFSQNCTHLSCAVVPRMKEQIFYCPCHHGYFDLLSGRPIAGPPRRPLPRITLEVRGGIVYATGVEARTV